MPQLDINTFKFQYFSLMILFLFVYFLLSYLVLPLTLRAIIIRSRVSRTSEKLVFPDTFSYVEKVKKLINNSSIFTLLVNASHHENNKKDMQKISVNFVIPQYDSFIILALLEEEKNEVNNNV